MAAVSKQKKVKNMRQKLKLFRSNEPLKSVLMWGINYSFSSLNHVKPRVVLLKDDFKAYIKVKVNNHLFNKENMPSRFKYKEYCPMVFQSLRDRFGVNKLDYWDAFTRHQPLWDSARGKSGSKFLVTYNRQFVAKTISSEEVEQMHHMLEEYYGYIVNCHGQTLLPQYLGLYRLSVNDQETYILVMRNVFSPRMAIHKKFDLKCKILYDRRATRPTKEIRRSSTIHSYSVYDSESLTEPTCGRDHHKIHRRPTDILTGGSAVDREANEKEKSKPLPTLKDADFLNDICKIHIGDEAKARLLHVLESDIQFLQDNNLMDYSLLIGIHDLDKVDPIGEFCEDNGGSPLDSNRAFEDRIASAGDGLGTWASQCQLSQMSSYRPSVVANSNQPNASLFNTSGAVGGNLSAGDDDEDEDGTLIETGGPTTLPGNLTPPDSPPGMIGLIQPFTGELHPSLEFYGIKSSPTSSHSYIYFIAIIDILTRYGMRKRTAQTYKTVKHGSGAEISTVKPETYGHRLIDFVAQCVD